MWRDFTARLGRLFGGKGNGGPGFKGDPRGTGIGIAIITVILLLLWVLSGYFNVPPGQTAVVTTFGKLTRTTGEGVNWRWPYPIQNNELVNLSDLRTLEIGGAGSQRPAADALMLTEDENVVGVQMTVQYKVTDAVSWLFNNHDAEANIKQAAETVIREEVGKSNIKTVLSSSHEKLAADVGSSMQQMLDRYKTGAKVTSVNILAVQLPVPVQAAYDEVQKAGLDKTRVEKEAQDYAKETVQLANIKADAMKRDADAYSANIKLKAQAETTHFAKVASEYQKAPAITRDRMYIETMQQIYSSTTKVMVDGKGGNNVIYLPIDKLVAQSQANENGPKGTVTISTPVQTEATPNPAAANAGTNASATPSAPADMNQALESQRVRDARARESREREVR